MTATISGKDFINAEKISIHTCFGETDVVLGDAVFDGDVITETCILKLEDGEFFVRNAKQNWFLLKEHYAGDDPRIRMILDDYTTSTWWPQNWEKDIEYYTKGDRVYKEYTDSETGKRTRRFRVCNENWAKRYENAVNRTFEAVERLRKRIQEKA